MVPGVLLEPYMSQGDQGVAETPIVSKGLKLRFKNHMSYHMSYILLILLPKRSIQKIIFIPFNFLTSKYEGA